MIFNLSKTKLTAISLIFVFLFSAGIIFAQEDLPTEGGTANDNLFGDTAGDATEDPPAGEEYPFTDDGQYTGTDSGTTADYSQSDDDDSVELEETENPVPHKEYPDTGSEPDSSNVAEGLFECSVSGILSNVIGSAIKGVINNAIGSIVGGIAGTDSSGGDSEKRVPIFDIDQSKKETGTTLAGIPIIPSWDSIAYCLANKTIAYISDATVYWIRTGFEGNPAFVDDPEKFFEQVADFEYESFIDDVVSELTCEPFRSSVTKSVSKSYNNTFEKTGKCSLYDGTGDVDGFLNGTSFDYDTWNRYTQNSANNPIGSALIMQGELGRRISVSQSSIDKELDWGNGYLPWKNKEGKTVSPGNVIESQLEKSLNISKDKIGLADEFDEVLSELINYLVKFALDETLGMVKSE